MARSNMGRSGLGSTRSGEPGCRPTQNTLLRISSTISLGRGMDRPLAQRLRRHLTALDALPAVLRAATGRRCAAHVDALLQVSPAPAAVSSLKRVAGRHTLNAAGR